MNTPPARLLPALCLAFTTLAAGDKLLQTAEWQSVPLPPLPAPRTITAIPLLRNLPDDLPGRVARIREHGVRLQFVAYPNGGTPRLPTTAFLCFTETRLLALLEGRQTKGYELREHRYEKEDAHIWSDDNFEIFVDPFLSRSDYIHFIVNPRGDIFDQRCLVKRVPDPKAADPSEMIVKVVQDPAYNSGASVPVMKGEDRWSAVFQLPFTAFGLEAPPLGQVWGLNVCHTNRENDELSQWQPTPGSRGFHQPQLFGALRFGRKTTGPQGTLSLAHLGGGENRILARIGNPGKKTTVRWSVALSAASGQPVIRATGKLGVPPGESSHELSFQAPFNLRGPCRIAVELSAAGKTFSYFVRNLELAPTVTLSLPLKQIYPTDPLIQGTVRLALGEPAFGATGMPVILEITGPGLRRSQRFDHPRGNILRFGIDPQGFPPGEYTLRASYGRIASGRQRLTLIAPPFDF